MKRGAMRNMHGVLVFLSYETLKFLLNNPEMIRIDKNRFGYDVLYDLIKDIISLA